MAFLKKDSAQDADSTTIKDVKEKRNSRDKKKTSTDSEPKKNVHEVKIKEGPKFVWGAGKKTKPPIAARAIRSLAMILRVGESEARALEIVGEQFHKYSIGRQFQRAATAMREEGASFKQAILHENDVFPRTVKELIQAAPTAQSMIKNLEKSARLVAEAQDAKKKLLTAMIQPGFMLGMSIVFLFVATTWIIPNFSNTFSQLQAETPKATIIVNKAAEIVKWSIGGLIVLILLWVGFWFIYGKRSAKVRRLMDTIVLKLPIIGSIMQLSACSKLFDMLVLNIEIGMNEPVALETAGKSCGNDAIAQHCIAHAQRMRDEGIGLKDAFDSNYFPVTARYMIQSAPSTLQELNIMSELSPEFKAEADMQTEQFTRTVEPIMTYIVYGVAGLLIIGIVIPMFAIYPALMSYGDNATGDNSSSLPPTS